MRNTPSASANHPKVEEVPQDEIDDAEAALNAAGVKNPSLQQISDYITNRYGDDIVSQKYIDSAKTMLGRAGLPQTSENVQALINSFPNSEYSERKITTALKTFGKDGKPTIGQLTRAIMKAD